MHHTDLDIDRLSAQVQAAMEAYFNEPFPDRLFLWERMAKKLWGMEQDRRKELIEGGFGDIGHPVWRGPGDRRPTEFVERGRR
jgi:hypothetical protein